VVVRVLTISLFYSIIRLLKHKIVVVGHLRGSFNSLRFKMGACTKFFVWKKDDNTTNSVRFSFHDCIFTRASLCQGVYANLDIQNHPAALLVSGSPLYGFSKNFFATSWPRFHFWVIGCFLSSHVAADAKNCFSGCLVSILLRACN